MAILLEMLVRVALTTSNGFRDPRYPLQEEDSDDQVEFGC